jgi:hypothetical protein
MLEILDFHLFQYRFELFNKISTHEISYDL